MGNISSLTVKMRADSSQFQTGIKQARNSMAGFKNTALSLKNLAVGAIAVGFVAMSREALRAGDQIEKLNTKIGASAEALSQLRVVSELSGFSFGTLAKSLEKLEVNTADAAAGTGLAKTAFQSLGIHLKQFKGLKPENKLMVLADALKGVKSQTDKAAISYKIFGRAGIELLPALADGSKGLREMMASADALGKTLSLKDVKAIAETNDAVQKMNESFGAMAEDLTKLVSPALTVFADIAAATARSVRQFYNLVGSFGSSVAGDFASLFGFKEAAKDLQAFSKEAFDSGKGLLGLVDRVKKETQSGVIDTSKFFQAASKTTTKAKNPLAGLSLSPSPSVRVHRAFREIDLSRTSLNSFGPGAVQKVAAPEFAEMVGLLKRLVNKDNTAFAT